MYAMQKTLPFNDTHKQLEDEVKSLRASIREVHAENKVIEDELDNNIQKLVQWNVQLENSPNFFKSARSQQQILSNTKNLKELNYNLKNTLNSYPEFNAEEADQVNYVNDFHQKYLEHHSLVGVIAAECFKSFDEYFYDLGDLNSVGVLSV